MRVRIKICGITRLQDGSGVVRAGADAIGFVFFPSSPRMIDAEQASWIARGLPPFLTKVGVFANPEPDEVHSILRCVPLDLLQFHGDESPELCDSFQRSYVKAVRVHPGVNISEYEERYPMAAALLLDTHVAEKVGGTGLEFDWRLIPPVLQKPLILAGGLTAANVGAAIRQVKPFAVDVSSGVESAPGVKDPAKISEFVTAVARAGIPGVRGTTG